jgi:hypothetical protein
MLIANPIYDVVFKRLMENEKVAKFFIGTLLEENIEALEVKPQEFTFMKELAQDDPQAQQYITQQLRERFSINVQRLDFVATIRTATGQARKVLIEIQKARSPVDLMRFRNYLAEQYKKQDKVDGRNLVLPITTIYILGFNLPEIVSPCIKVAREYIDLVDKTIITQKSEFVEKLTHDSFVVQVERITNRFQTRLDKLLSIFEQRNFVDDREITKDYPHVPDLEELKTMTDILHYVGTDPKERKEIEKEQEAWRTMKAMIDDTEHNYLQALAELKEKEKIISEKDQALNEKDRALAEQARLIEELQKKLGGPQ